MKIDLRACFNINLGIRHKVYHYVVLYFMLDNRFATSATKSYNSIVPKQEIISRQLSNQEAALHFPRYYQDLEAPRRKIAESWLREAGKTDRSLRQVFIADLTSASSRVSPAMALQIHELVRRIKGTAIELEQKMLCFKTPYGDLMYNRSRNTARSPLLPDQEVKLTPFEGELLAYFMQHPTAVVSREMMYRLRFGDDIVPSVSEVDTFKSYVLHLRQKLGQSKTNEYNGGKQLIYTIYGRGYSLAPYASERADDSQSIGDTIYDLEETTETNRPRVYRVQTAYGMLILYADRGIAPFRPDQQIPLTKTETLYLETLMANPKRVHTKYKLTQLAMGVTDDPLPAETEGVRTHISHKRTKAWCSKRRIYLFHP